jgi:hypothetical protein
VPLESRVHFQPPHKSAITTDTFLHGDLCVDARMLLTTKEDIVEERASLLLLSFFF